MQLKFRASTDAFGVEASDPKDPKGAPCAVGADRRSNYACTGIRGAPKGLGAIREVADRSTVRFHLGVRGHGSMGVDR